MILRSVCNKSGESTRSILAEGSVKTNPDFIFNEKPQAQKEEICVRGMFGGGGVVGGCVRGN